MPPCSVHCGTTKQPSQWQACEHDEAVRWRWLKARETPGRSGPGSDPDSTPLTRSLRATSLRLRRPHPTPPLHSTSPDQARTTAGQRIPHALALALPVAPALGQPLALAVRMHSPDLTLRTTTLRHPPTRISTTTAMGSRWVRMAALLKASGCSCRTCRTGGWGLGPMLLFADFMLAALFRCQKLPWWVCFAPHCGRRSARLPYAAGSTPMPTRDAAAQLDQPHSCSRNSRAPAWARCTWRACHRPGGAPLSPTATPTPSPCPSPSPTVCALRALSALHPKGAHWGVLEVCSATRRGPCPSRPPFSAPWCTDIPGVGCD